SSVTSNAATLTTGTAPTITTQPVSQTICSGNATFTVAATGAGLSYQWKRGTTNVGTNSNTLVTNVAGTYTVVVTNSCSSVTSNAATLTVGGSPAITTQPVSQTICSGSATFTVAATGTGLSYQWKRGNTNVGTNSNSYVTSTAGTYTVVISNNCGNSVTSSAATLTINNTVSITTQPVSQTICSGSATFNVAASGVGLSYQWKRGNTNVGTNSSSYSTNVAGTYTVVVTNSCGASVTSNAAILTTASAPSITTQPVSQTICSGNATFTVAATGTGLNYQWRRDGVNISGATSSSYTTNVAANYSVVISNSCGNNVTSNTASLTMTSAVGGSALINNVQSVNTCYGNTVTVSLSGQTGNVTRWEYSTGNSGSWQTINTTQTTITRTVTQNTAFRAIVAISSNCTPATSSIANVTVTSTGIGGTVSIANTVVCRGASAVFTLSGNTGTVLGWQYSTNGGSSWTNVSNTSGTLVYSNATQNRRYRAVVRGCFGSTIVYSTSVAITVVNCNTRNTQSNETKTTNIVEGNLEATAYPNPSQTYFNLQVKSSNNSDIEIKVFDMSGKQVDQMRGAAYETYRFGNNLVAGTYIVEVRQGNEKITTKVIKF
ncbi:MAG: T9SS type A sorting domain-containing protein, partial [Bacteroidetes bacterium]|nr:T9SS type A sorting domain-containing protein [Bacteroidota bacterium]